MVHHDPQQQGFETARWTLATIRSSCSWLRLTTPAGLHQLLKRLGVVWKRGREHVHSPDPDYDEKLVWRDDVIRQARVSRGRIVALYQDELTFYRQPTLVKAYAERGHAQPVAELSYHRNTKSRVVATLDVLTGRVLYRRRALLDLDDLVAFYRTVREAYPQAEIIYIMLDNWPIHFHPDVLVSLQEQEFRWPLHRCSWWPTEPSAEAVRRYSGLALPIRLVQLPTYAPWTNPIEKLWRWLYQDVLHLHRLSDQLDALRARVDRFLDQFAHGSLSLLQYVGLLQPGFNC